MILELLGLPKINLKNVVKAFDFKLYFMIRTVVKLHNVLWHKHVKLLAQLYNYKPHH